MTATEEIIITVIYCAMATFSGIVWVLYLYAKREIRRINKENNLLIRSISDSEKSTSNEQN